MAGDPHRMPGPTELESLASRAMLAFGHAEIDYGAKRSRDGSWVVHVGCNPKRFGWIECSSSSTDTTLDLIRAMLTAAAKLRTGAVDG